MWSALDNYRRFHWQRGRRSTLRKKAGRGGLKKHLAIFVQGELFSISDQHCKIEIHTANGAANGRKKVG